MMRRWLACLLLVPFVASAPADRIRWDAGWKFQIEKVASETEGIAITDWSWNPAPDGTNSDSAPQIQYAAQPVKVGTDVFHGKRGFAWFHTLYTQALPGNNLPADKQLPWVLHFASVDDNATVWVNGQKLTHHEGWDDAFDAPISSIWNFNGSNHIDVLVENTDGMGGIYRRVALLQQKPEPAPLPALPGFTDRTWRQVHLPHDYVIEGTFSPEGDPNHGSLIPSPAWYRKHFKLPMRAKDSSVWLDFDGVFSDAKVYLNGHLVGSHRGGYNGFSVNLNQGDKHGTFLKFGVDNVLAVHVDARKFEGWWYEGGGIYRHVWLNVTPKVHIPTDGVYAKAVVEDLASHRASLSVETMVKNDGDHSAKGEVLNQIFGPNGAEVGRSFSHFTVPPHNSKAVIPPTIELTHASLWSIETPTLYRVETTVIVGQKIANRNKLNVGFRELRFDANEGFFLNGKHVKINGTCNHQDFIGVGTGMPDSVLEWRIKTLKGIGCNAYRTSHNEVAPELLDACDRLGMVVMDENREFGDGYSGKANKNTTTKNLWDIAQLVRRDRNHPSIIMWSIANEEGVQGTPTGKRIGTVYKRIIRSLDTTRPVVAAINYDHGRGLGDVTDLEGYNYSPGEYPSYHASHPGHPMFGSETASALETRGEYADDPKKGYVTSYDQRGTQTVEDAWEPIGAYPYMEGGFVWTGFDYKGEPTPYVWPCVNSHFGILDMCGFWKDGAWYYLAWWGNKPTVHIFPHWNWQGQEGKPINVWAYGNGDEVELFLNGKSLGRKAMPKFRHAEWQVPYQPGTLMALSYKNGVTVSKDVVKTTGPAYRLRLSTDRTRLTGDNEDITMVKVEVVDKNGLVVPGASNFLQFTVSGPATIAGVGNGDPSCHEPDQAESRSAFHGLAMVLVRAKRKTGIVTLKVSSPGLVGDTLGLNVKLGDDPVALAP
jgi:beta-galactosidase